MWPGGPTSFPAAVTLIGLGGPLFDVQQLLRMRKLERNAPLLMKREPELARPGRMPAEHRQGSLKDGAAGGARPLWLAEEEEAHWGRRSEGIREATTDEVYDAE